MFFRAYILLKASFFFKFEYEKLLIKKKYFILNYTQFFFE